jgi:hypothetical protein
MHRVQRVQRRTWRVRDVRRGMQPPLSLALRAQVAQNASVVPAVRRRVGVFGVAAVRARLPAFPPTGDSATRAMQRLGTFVWVPAEQTKGR